MGPVDAPAVLDWLLAGDPSIRWQALASLTSATPDEVAARRACGVLWDAASTLDGGLNLAVTIREPETCITGMLVHLAARFGEPDEPVDDAVLRGLEHFAVVGAPTDPRLEDAVAVVRSARQADGRWRRHRSHPGREWFRMEQPGPSRWTTLRSLRVLQWWDGQG